MLTKMKEEEEDVDMTVMSAYNDSLLDEMNYARDKRLWRRSSIADDMNEYLQERDQKKESSLEDNRY